jgi:hypothetical protein
VLLMIMAFGAAVTVEFTRSFSQARLTDREYGEILRDSMHVLAQRPLPAPGTTVELLKTSSLSRRDVQVSATVQQPEIGKDLLGSALRMRQGDQVVELTAAPLSTGRICRGAVYLVNTAGQRNTPILLLEKRP